MTMPASEPQVPPVDPQDGGRMERFFNLKAIIEGQNWHSVEQEDLQFLVDVIIDLGNKCGKPVDFVRAKMGNGQYQIDLGYCVLSRNHDGGCR